jgi:hypothetical protein
MAVAMSMETRPIRPRATRVSDAFLSQCPRSGAAWALTMDLGIEVWDLSSEMLGYHFAVAERAACPTGLGSLNSQSATF